MQEKEYSRKQKSGGKRHERGRKRARGEKVGLLFPVTPGQSCRSPPVIELHLEAKQYVIKEPCRAMWATRGGHH